MGYLPQAMVNYLALLGWGDGTENEFFTIDDLGLFSIFFFLSFSLKYSLVPIE
jgi:glutamyl-tRNA synthetase